MTAPRRHRPLTPGLALSLALAMLACSSPAQAQPLSSGSGTGTGTGMSGGAARNSTGTGQESGTGPRSLPSNSPMLPSSGPLGGSGRSGRSDPAAAGLNVMDPLLPADNVSGLSVVTERQLEYANRLTKATDRSLALSRVASAATFSLQLGLAERALNDATTAAMEAAPGMIRDQRIMSIIASTMYLAEARLRDRSTENFPAEANGTSPSSLPKADRKEHIRQATRDWRRAAVMSEQITNPTYKNEMMYKVADSMALGSQNIINTFPKLQGATVTAATGVNQSYDGLPDQLLEAAAALALKIDRPVWRDRGLVQVASAAAESKQFARAVEVVSKIPQPEVRTDGLLKIADVQARRGDPDGATDTYKLAATAVASIPLDDPRAVLAGVLIDDLIAVGRFEDARKSVPLYPDEPRRLVALGAIAESQGRRGAAATALEWIRREAPPEYQSLLYRKVSNGVVAAIEANRSRDLSGAGRDR